MSDALERLVALGSGLPVPRLPLAGDPLRRVRVPHDLGSVTARATEETDVRALGMTTEGIDRIWAGVQRLYRSGFYPAIALCVRRHGEVVLDRAIGHARGNGPTDGEDAARTPATPQTPFVIFSASKAMTTVVTHLLEQRGLLHVGDRVCEYIPEYATHGKEVITIEHLLSHRAGVPSLPAEAFDLDRFGDRKFRLEMLCTAKPSSRPGRLLSYHAVSGGFIIAEIVQRVTGRDIRTVLREEILRPLGFRWGNYGVRPRDVGRVAVSYPTGPPALPPLSTVLQRALGLPADELTVLSNDPRFLTGVVPSGNVVTTANELSRFFELLRAGGELDGVRILEPRTIRRAVSERSFREIDFSLVAPLRHASGLMLGASALSLYGPDTDEAFGHLGFTNVLGWADPERALSVGLMTSGKPLLHPALGDLWLLTRAIGQEAPKVARTGIWFTER
jgi:CubicO group peptidase (beta-lactamase class C family)